MKKKHFLLVALALLTLFLVTSCEEEKPEPLPPINTYGLDERWFCNNIDENRGRGAEPAYGCLYCRFLENENDAFRNKWVCSEKGTTRYECVFLNQYYPGGTHGSELQIVVDGKVQTLYGFIQEPYDIKYSHSYVSYVFDNSTGVALPARKIIGVLKYDFDTKRFENITGTEEATPYLGWIIYKEMSDSGDCVLVTDPTDLYLFTFKSGWSTNLGNEVFSSSVPESMRKFTNTEKVSAIAGLGPDFIVCDETRYY